MLQNLLQLDKVYTAADSAAALPILPSSCRLPPDLMPLVTRHIFKFAHYGPFKAAHEELERLWAAKWQLLSAADAAALSAAAVAWASADARRAAKKARVKEEVETALDPDVSSATAAAFDAAVIAALSLPHDRELLHRWRGGPPSSHLGVHEAHCDVLHGVDNCNCEMGVAKATKRMLEVGGRGVEVVDVCVAGAGGVGGVGGVGRAGCRLVGWAVCQKTSRHCALAPRSTARPPAGQCFFTWDCICTHHAGSICYG